MAIRPNPLGGCVKVFEKGIRDLELLDLFGEKASDELVKKQSRIQVNSLNTQLEKLQKEGMPVSQAVNVIMEQWKKKSRGLDYKYKTN